MRAWQLGPRTLLAATCYGCGVLLPGEKFKRHLWNVRDSVSYVDRRCTSCKWGVWANVKGARY